jgi:hypothetical protein|tara:strand:- start:93 stop:335 length:243 start_codon:yes stop_codon:yes gene_type:complete
MKTEFRVINRTTREEQVFNCEELQRFFYCEYDSQTQKIKYNNEMSDYAISLKRTDTEKILLIINCLAIFGTSIYLLSQWI